MFDFLFYFDFVESFSVYSDYLTLWHKGIRVYVFYQPEDNGWFPFFGKYKQHFYFLAGIESGSIYNCRAAVRIHIDMSGYLLILFADDEKLHGLACTVYYLIQNETTDV